MSPLGQPPEPKVKSTRLRPIRFMDRPPLREAPDGRGVRRILSDRAVLGETVASRARGAAAAGQAPTLYSGRVTALAVTLALLCAATFAISTSVQPQAAESAPASATGLFSLLAYLIRRPMWLLGQLLATCAFALHASALHSGPIAMVQPIVVSGIVWAVPVRAAISRRLPSVTELRAVLVTAVGLAVFLVASNPSPGSD